MTTHLAASLAHVRRGTLALEASRKSTVKHKAISMLVAKRYQSSAQLKQSWQRAPGGAIGLLWQASL